jgi:phenylpropionate dioxygenase-like ring-hydroxylating dioxygenase large terminal subunit
MGDLIRRYWIPALLCEEIPEADCPPVRVRLLGEDLVAFRDSQGRVGLLDEYCSHRRASLFYGRNEHCGLRCIYHGWKYDVEGNVLETPAEPPDSTLKHKVHHTAYPCREAAGVVFAYMGPRKKMPLFPNYEWLTVPLGHATVTAKFFNECNYLQALEGDCDSSHINYLHRGSIRGGLDFHEDAAPVFEFEMTSFGMRTAAIRRVVKDKKNIRSSVFIMPCIGCVPVGRMVNGKLDGFQVVYQVPADDYHTWRYNVRFSRSGPVPAEEVEPHRCQIAPEYLKKANRGNDYLIDRNKQRLSTYSGIEGIATQDACVTESMGPICDRTREHLGVSDSYVIAVRKYLLKALREFQQGVDPPGLAWDPAKHDFSGANCVDVTVPLDTPWNQVLETR